MTNPYLNRRAKHTIGKAGRKSENRLAKVLGARQRPASGALLGAKGDISFDNILMEAKSTTCSSISIKLAWLLKITHEARSEGKIPALSLSFTRPDGNPYPDGEWVALPLHKYLELLSLSEGE